MLVWLLILFFLVVLLFGVGWLLLLVVVFCVGMVFFVGFCIEYLVVL